LETRALDFNNVIMLSVNEGVMPGTDSSATFIPYNLRKGFGLPTIEHQDSVYAYYFYRLLQRSNNIALLYNSQGGSLTGEMSRFIYQLRYDSAFTIKEQGLNFRISLSEEKNITIHKTETILNILNRFLSVNGDSQYLTPTAINTYLECTLRYYFRYVAGIHVKEEITENIEGSMFGKLLHYSVRQVYSIFKGIQMNEHDFDRLIKDDNFLESCVLKAFAAEFFKSEDELPKLYGNSILVKEVLLKYIRQILQVDKKFAPINLLDFEKTVKTIIPFDVNGNTKYVNIGGKIDRIDKTGDVFRVIDYKTGRVEYSIKSIEKLFEVEGKNQNKDIFQILFYAIVLSEYKNFSHLPVITSIYGLHDIYKQNFDPRIYISKNEMITNINHVKSSYMESLQGLLSEIFNPDIPFVKVTDKKRCEFCEFKMICHRG
jgi:CRISPR/Cas system-associated exonuclease Cas4 (RecB family)